MVVIPPTPGNIRAKPTKPLPPVGVRWTYWTQSDNKTYLERNTNRPASAFLLAATKGDEPNATPKTGLPKTANNQPAGIASQPEPVPLSQFDSVSRRPVAIKPRPKKLSGLRSVI